MPPLSVARRTYLDKYRHSAHVALASGTLAVPVSVPPGWVALTYRFVDAGTGQQTAVVEMGIVRVE